MRGTLIVMMVAMLIFGGLMAAGCGGKSETTEKTEVVDANKPVAESIIGVYVEGTDHSATTGGSLAILKGGEWEGSAWGSEKKGTYKVKADPQNVITFTFEDGTTETWSVQIANGKVAAIVSPQGRQFTMQEKQE